MNSLLHLMKAPIQSQIFDLHIQKSSIFEDFSLESMSVLLCSLKLARLSSHSSLAKAEPACALHRPEVLWLLGSLTRMISSITDNVINNIKYLLSYMVYPGEW